MATRDPAVPAVYLILRKEGKILLASRVNTGYEDGMFQVPAGHVDAGELPQEAMVREAKEEIGIIVKPEDLEFVHISYRPKCDPTGARVDLFFSVSEYEGEPTIMEPHKCDELRWVFPRELPENMSPHVQSAIEHVEKGTGYSEITLDTLKAGGYYKL